MPLAASECASQAIHNRWWNLASRPALWSFPPPAAACFPRTHLCCWPRVVCICVYIWGRERQRGRERQGKKGRERETVSVCHCLCPQALHQHLSIPQYVRLEYENRKLFHHSATMCTYGHKAEGKRLKLSGKARNQQQSTQRDYNSSHSRPPVQWYIRFSRFDMTLIILLNKLHRAVISGLWNSSITFRVRSGPAWSTVAAAISLPSNRYGS